MTFSYISLYIYNWLSLGNCRRYLEWMNETCLRIKTDTLQCQQIPYLFSWLQFFSYVIALIFSTVLLNFKTYHFSTSFTVLYHHWLFATVKVLHYQQDYKFEMTIPREYMSFLCKILKSYLKSFPRPTYGTKIFLYFDLKKIKLI